MQRTFSDIEEEIDEIADHAGAVDAVLSVTRLVACGEDVLAQWVLARGEIPTEDIKEGFRLLALQRQGSKGEPSFNACRETARELAYHYNLVTDDDGHDETKQRVLRAAFAARHLCLFVSAKLQVAGLGEFCCAAKPVRANDVDQMSIAQQQANGE